MSKVPATTIKYNIYADVLIDGVVEKPDVVGAVFGQTEGLLGEDLELRELQKSGRIGRIEADITSKNGKSVGKIIIPSSLDKVETAIIASAVETVDRVGPCKAEIKVTSVEDARFTRRKQLINRAKEILKKLMEEEIPVTQTIINEIRESVQVGEITNYKGLPAGPSLEESDSIIIVEGRADILNLLKYGIKNTIAVEGTNIPQEVIDLSKDKTVTAFLDGDRGGDIILKELAQTAKVDYVARAPKGTEVEELGKKDVIMALRKKVPANQIKWIDTVKVRDDNKILLSELEAVKGKMHAKLFDKDLKLITEIEVKDLINSLKDVGPDFVVLDGIITQRLVDIASQSGVSCLVGINKSEISDARGVKILIEK
jgi:DNA primase